MRRVELVLAVLVVAGCAADGVDETPAAESSSTATTTPATTRPPATSAQARVFSMRPVLGSFTVSPALADPNGDHPASVDPGTGLTIVDDVATEAYLNEPFTDQVLWVGPAFLTGADIESAEAFLVSGPADGGDDSWMVVPEFTPQGRAKFRAATTAMAQEPAGSPPRQLAIVVDGEVISAPWVADDVGPEGLDPDVVVITIFGADNPRQAAEDLAAILQR